jgi:iron complex outermembrane recepter protein
MSFLRGACKGPRSGVRGSISGLNFIAAALLAGALCASAARAGELDQVCVFNIPAQPLDKALLQFGTQAHIQLSVSLNSPEPEPMTRTLKGTYTAKQALDVLLVGTGLRYALHGFTVEIRQGEAIHTSATTAPSGTKRGSTRSLTPANSSDPSPTENDPPPTTDGTSKDWLQEIIVTAQKYRQSAFDVPISLDVVSGQQLLQYSITNLSDLQYDVPGLYMNSTGVSHAVYLRGVGNDNGNGAMVGQYIDDADITAEDTSGESGTATGDNGLYDLNRVEVLKGPQGTLYGDGSMGGVIRYITNKPVLDQFQMSADFSELFTQYGAPSQRTDAMLNTPLIQGTLGLRFAGIFEHDGGWVDEPTANLKNINDGNLVDVRTEGLWQPSAHFKINATQIVHRHASGLGMGEDTSGNITPPLETTLTPHQTDNSNISNVTMTYDFKNAELLSSSTYYNETQDIYDLFSTLTDGPLIFGELIPSYNYYNEDYSQEIRLGSNEGGGAWHWTVGGFYKHFRDALFYPETYFGVGGSPLALAAEFPGASERNVSSSWAGFVDTSYEIFQRLTFGAGARYYDDREATSSLPTDTFTSVDPRLYMQYRMTSHINSYVSASKGFRSGGANVPPEPTFRPENLWSYELGIKMRLLDERMAIDVDLFDMDYSNYVTIVYHPPVYETANAGSARIKGADADLTYHLEGGWQVGINTELLNTRFLTASAISGYVPGDRLPYAPTYSITASVGHGFRWKSKNGVIELYGYEISRVQDRQDGAPLAQSDVLRFLNFRASVYWNNRLRFGMFAQNLLNDRGIEGPDYIFSGEAVRPRPRTIGIDFDVDFSGR